MLMVGVDEGKVAEDAGKEDMFVDCPDELLASADGKEAAAAAAAAEMGENSDKLHSQDPNESPGAYAADVVERLRAMLDKTVSEKESVAREYQVEWIMIFLVNFFLMLFKVNT